MTQCCREIRLFFGFFWILGPLMAAAASEPAIVAHRGLLKHAPENTLANFRACVELGLGFEFDVARTRDGHLVCIHDETVDRTTDGSGKVAQMDLSRIRELDAGSWFGPEFAGQRVPTIDEVLGVIAADRKGSAIYAVDLKIADAEREIVEKALRLGILDRLVFIGRTISDPAVRARIKGASPKARTAVVAHDSAERISAIKDGNSDWVYFRYIPTSEEVQAVHAAGKKGFLAGVTVAGHLPGNWRKAAEAGVDAILTDASLELATMLRGSRNPAK